MAIEKLICKECDWCGDVNQVLIGENPFTLGEHIYGCPECRSIESFMIACEHTGCWKKVSCGIPTKDGYAFTPEPGESWPDRATDPTLGYTRTCGKHAPKHKGED